MNDPLNGLTDEQSNTLRSLPGVIATVVTTGSVKPQFAEALSDMRSWCDRNGFHATEWRQFYALFVEAGRDAVAQHMMKNGYAWMLQIDADAAPFPPTALARFLRIAFLEKPETDVLGAYCQQKGYPYLPTIDTGTGKWEEHYPNSGLFEVIRTGCHFFLTKRRAIEKMGSPPWFRSRRPPSDLQILTEFDSLARRTLDGENPFTQITEYGRILRAAHEAEEGAQLRGGFPDLVGEDSGFCDRLRAFGGRIFVDTDTVVGHVATKIIGPSDLKEAMAEKRRKLSRTVGVDE